MDRQPPFNRLYRLSTAIDAYVRECRLRLAPLTVRCYESDLQQLLAFAYRRSGNRVSAFTSQLVMDYFMEEASRQRKLSTMMRRRTVFKEFAKWGMRKRLWRENPMEHAPRFRPPDAIPRPFSIEERERLWALPLPQPEKLLRALLFRTGLRVSSICNIRVSDISLQPRELEGGLIEYGSLRTIGKGNRPHVLPIDEEVSRLLKDYIDEVAVPNRYTYLFQRPSGGPVLRATVERRTRIWGQRAGVANCSPHRFRHTCATELRERGEDLAVIKEYLNHRDVQSTMIYTRVANASLARAAARLVRRPSPSGNQDSNTPPLDRAPTASGATSDGAAALS